MTQLHKLFRAHVFHIAETRDLYCTGRHAGVPKLSAWLRAEQFLRLDILLMKHRVKFGTCWEPLEQNTSLNLLLFARTQWPLEKIEGIAFPEKLLLLHEDLASLHIPAEFPKLIPIEAWEDAGYSHESYADVRKPFGHIELPPCSEDDWDCSLAQSRVQDWHMLLQDLQYSDS